MGQSNPIASFSVYAVAIIDPVTGKPAGKPIQVLESSSLNFSGENINLTGGALRTPWEIESGDITAEMSLNFSEYPAYLTEYLLGATVTSIAASTGEVLAPVAGVGSSILSATNGIASIGALVGSEANLKTAKYFLVATAAQVASLYADTDIDFANGTEKEFLNDDNLIAADLDFSADVSLADFGLDFTIAGIPAFTVGDTIEFDVNSENDGGYTFDVGSASSQFPEFRAIVYAEVSSTGQMLRLDCFRCQATGMPLGFNRKQFSNSEVTIGLKYDNTRKKIYSGKQIKLK